MHYAITLSLLAVVGCASSAPPVRYTQPPCPPRMAALEVPSRVWPATVECSTGVDWDPLGVTILDRLTNGSGIEAGDGASAHLEALAAEHGRAVVACWVELVARHFDHSAATDGTWADAAMRARNFLRRADVRVTVTP